MRILLSLLLCFFCLHALVFSGVRADAPVATATPAPAEPTGIPVAPTSKTPPPPAPAASTPPAAPPQSTPTPTPTPTPVSTVDFSPILTKLDSVASASSSILSQLQSVSSHLASDSTSLSAIQQQTSSFSSSISSSIEANRHSQAERIESVEKQIAETKKLIQDLIQQQQQANAASQAALAALQTATNAAAAAAAAASSAAAPSSSSSSSEGEAAVLAKLNFLSEQQSFIMRKVNESFADHLSWAAVEEKLAKGSAALKKFGNRTWAVAQEQWPIYYQLFLDYSRALISIIHEWTKDLPAHAVHFSTIARVQGIQHFRSLHSQLTSILSDLSQKWQFPIVQQHLEYASYGILGFAAFVIGLITLSVVWKIIRMVCCCGLCGKKQSTKKKTGTNGNVAPTANLRAKEVSASSTAATAAAAELASKEAAANKQRVNKANLKTL